MAILPFYDLYCTVLQPYINRTLVVSTVTRLQATQPIHRASNPIRGKRLLLSTQPPDGLWGPPSYFMSTGDVSSLAKNPVERRIWPLTSIWCTEIKKGWSYTSTNLHVLMARIVTTLTRQGKGNSEIHSRSAHEGRAETQFCSLTSALDRGWSTPRPGRFAPRKEAVHTVHEAG